VTAIRVLLADDHAIVRAGVRALLERQDGIEVVAEADDGASAVTLALAERPRVAVLDVSMPLRSGVEACREIRAHAPEIGVLILSMHDDERWIWEALHAGAGGYVLKHQADRALVAAVRAVARDDPFVAPDSYAGLVARWRETEGGPPDPLTPRERQVVKLIAEAHTNREIAEVLGMAEKTVESHRANLLAKLGMSDRVELARYAVRRGLVEP
jgi:DNA-binding NarL/FixJ family response regulator